MYFHNYNHASEASGKKYGKFEILSLKKCMKKVGQISNSFAKTNVFP